MTALVRAIAGREVRRRYLAIAHGKAPAAASASRRRSAATRDAPAHGRHRLGQAGADRRRADRQRRHPERPALHPAHRAHPPDPGAPGVARPAAGRRPSLRRPAGRGIERQALHAAELAFAHPLRDGRSPSPRPCRPTWRRRGGNSPDRRLESGTAASLTITANRFDAIPRRAAILPLPERSMRSIETRSHPSVHLDDRPAPAHRTRRVPDVTTCRQATRPRTTTKT